MNLPKRLAWYDIALLALAACGEAEKPSKLVAPAEAQPSPKPPSAAVAPERTTDAVGGRVTTESEPVSLTANVSQSGARLDVHYTIHNGGRTPILVFNRLYQLAKSSTGNDFEGANYADEPDPQQVYRFVSGDVLNLLLGPAPLPRWSVFVKYVPEATRVAAHATFEGALSTPVPVTEHNLYFSRASLNERVAQQVHNVELFATYRDASGVETRPSKLTRGAWRVEHGDGMRMIRSGPVALTLDVLRETAEFPRLEPF